MESKPKKIEIDDDTYQELLDLRYDLGQMIDNYGDDELDQAIVEIMRDDSPVLEQAISLIDRITDAYEEA